MRLFGFPFSLLATLVGITSVVPAVLTPAAFSQSVEQNQTLVIDYPSNGSLFPPDFAAPLFRWRDATAAARWQIEVVFGDGSRRIRAKSEGEPMKVGEIDPDCVSEWNRPPALTAEEAAGHTWRPDPAIWKEIKAHSVRRPATVTVQGFAVDGKPLSSGSITVRTSSDSVGAPIF